MPKIFVILWFGILTHLAPTGKKICLFQFAIISLFLLAST
jgi:hypothetical protein